MYEGDPITDLNQQDQQQQQPTNESTDSENNSPLTYQSSTKTVSQEQPPTQLKSRNSFRSPADSSNLIISNETSSNSDKIIDDQIPQPPISNSPPQYNESQLKTNELNLLKTNIAYTDLITYPYKTLNRILDDIKWSIPMLHKFNYSLLNNKPIDYSNELQNLVNISHHNDQTWILNEKIDFSPSTETFQIDQTNQTVTILRGLITSKSRPDQINHFRIIILENVSNPFAIDTFDKLQYHLIPKKLITEHDLDLMWDNFNESDQILDDSYYKSANSPNNQILRVSIFKPEFDQEEDFKPLIDETIIKERYLSYIERHPDLSKDVIPTSVNCFQTLIKVLKGPLTFDGPQRTISLKGTAMETSIDVNLLLNKLSFTLSQDKEQVIPPHLNELPSLKESFKRKSMELIFFASRLLKDDTNSFHQYSFSDNMIQVFSRIPECDKNTSINNFNSNYSNRFQYFIALSASAYFIDDIIIKCFEHSIRSDPSNRLYYIDYLKDASNFFQYNSQTSKLKSYINKCQQSENFFGFKDYQQSLKDIGYPIGNTVQDDVLIAMYKDAYKNDPKNYQYYQNHLKRIAIALNSDTLKEFLAYEIIPMNLAISELGIEEITEDEVVITAFEFKVDDIMTQNMNPNSSEIIMLNKSLTSIAINRRSNLLLNYLEIKYPDYVKIPDLKKYTIQKSYETLNSTDKTSAFEIINQFQTKLLSNEVDIRVLRHCLRSIGEDKKSEILLSFLKTGKIDSSLLPPENWPAGLDNIGNTCYLNSLLQYYFCIKPLRELILNFDADNFNLDEVDENRKIGGRKVEKSEILRSNQFVYQLQNLFKQMIHTDKRCVQPSKELAYLSFLPLSQPVNFKEKEPKKSEVIEIVDSDVEIVENNDNNGIVEEETIIDIDNEDEDMKDSIDPPVHIETHTVEPQDLIEEKFIEKVETNNEEEAPAPPPENTKLLPISTDQMESTIELGRQQDVTECIENVVFQIESALPPDHIDKDDGEQIDLIKKLFYGKTKQTIQPIDKPDSIRESTERFNSLIINVSDHPKSIYDALDNYFNEDLVKLEEGLVKKSITITELPEIMQFHVQRVMFDREKLMAYKSIEPIPFSSEIYLDRYLDTKDEVIINKRSEVFNWKNQINELTKEKNEILQKDETTSLTIIDTLIVTKKYLENKIIQDDKLSIELTTLQVISDEISNLQNQLVKIDSKINFIQQKISNQFNDYHKIGYSIFAIFIHRGEASYGHYWIYIKDPYQNNVFRKYNDEIITEVQDSEVFNFLESNTATPYYIVYVKEDLEKEYINPLNRVIEKCG
ncbi:UBP2 [Candida jiufengensis]|uniref:UBP2 n=1 Tax=Candida jiufengensis TaxID=497108 RepID=UPI0022254F0B|nr:UBP2 [Candida jiufengensis]KAI5954229.1 UBP2 [Candida jiufengensis]